MGLRRSDGIPKGTTAQRPNPPAEGQLWKNTSTGNIEYYNGTQWLALGNITEETVGVPFTFYVSNPTSSEDDPSTFTNKAITITEVRAVVKGTSPSVTWTLRHGTDRSAAGTELITSGTNTTSTTTGADITSFTNPEIIADSHIWLETTATSGTVDSIAITVFYTVDQ